MEGEITWGRRLDSWVSKRSNFQIVEARTEFELGELGVAECRALDPLWLMGLSI